MNPLAAAAIGSVIRHVLTWGSGYLVSWGIWTEADAGTYVSAASMALVAFAWSYYQKRRQREELELKADRVSLIGR